MRADFVLRDAAPPDTPDVLRLIRGLAEYERMPHEATLSEADLHNALFGPQPRIHVLLAEVSGRSVGLALFYYTFNTFKARPNVFLEDLFVEPAFRGTGIGLGLMRRLAQLAVAEGCRRIEWRVLKWNQPSIDFYQHLGARPADAWHTRLLDGDALVSLAKGTSDG